MGGCHYVLRLDGLVWLSYFTHILLDISAPRTRIKVLFAALTLCCKANCFEYNKPKFEDNFLFGPKGGLGFCWRR